MINYQPAFQISALQCLISTVLLKLAVSNQSNTPFLASSAVLVSESIKLIICAALYLYREKSWSLANQNYGKIGIVALFYYLQNTMMYLGARHLDISSLLILFKYTDLGKQVSGSIRHGVSLFGGASRLPIVFIGLAVLFTHLNFTCGWTVVIFLCTSNVFAGFADVLQPIDDVNYTMGDSAMGDGLTGFYRRGIDISLASVLLGSAPVLSKVRTNNSDSSEWLD